MKEILVLHLGDGEETIPIAFLGEELLLRRVGTRGSLENIQACIASWDGKAAAIALEGLPDHLCLADACRDHEAGQRLAGMAKLSPLVDGRGVRATLERRGVMLAERYGSGSATLEAILAALDPDPNLPLSEDACLDLLANLEWTPDLRCLQPEEGGVNRFAFVIHPLSVDFIHKHPLFGWTRYLPDSLVEWVGAFFPPIYISKITGGRSPLTGQKVEGYLYSLGATPRQMMRHSDRFTYKRLNLAARMAGRRGARILGLGAFTSVVGDAGLTVARDADIAVTSGNSLTVAATLEAARQAMVKMGASDLTHGRVMVIGATGSIGSICARLLAQAAFDVVLVSIEPEKLIGLKQRILEETPGSRVTITTQAGEDVGSCDLIITATSAFGQRVLDITRCKPGAVICDVARPPDINPAEAALRPDVLVIESGEVLIPGDIDFGYDIGLPPKTAYACLAETALLAMEGRFEDYTIGRDISMERVKEIYRLFKKHRFQLAGLRSFGEYLTDEEIARKRAQADALRQDPLRYERLLEQTAVQIAAIPVEAKGVRAGNGGGAPRLLAGAMVGLARVNAAVKQRSLWVSRQTNHRNTHRHNLD